MFSAVILTQKKCITCVCFLVPLFVWSPWKKCYLHGNLVNLPREQMCIRHIGIRLYFIIAMVIHLNHTSGRLLLSLMSIYISGNALFFYFFTVVKIFLLIRWQQFWNVHHVCNISTVTKHTQENISCRK